MSSPPVAGGYSLVAQSPTTTSIVAKGPRHEEVKSPPVFPAILGVLQVIFIVLFALHATYGHEPEALTAHSLMQTTTVRSITYPNGTSEIISEHHEGPPHRGIVDFYGMFQDIHVMIFVGFGFLMTFLKRYGYSAVGYNFVVAAFVLEWALLIRGYMFDFDHTVTKTFPIGIEQIVVADFVAAAVLISFGAVLGKTNATQLIIMAMIEVVLQSANEWIGLKKFCAFDIGESMFVHVFGAYFGIFVARVLVNKEDMEIPEVDDKEKSNYHSDLFSMIGTLFLFCFWPSFNAGVALNGDDRLRAIVNTYISISASCLTTFIISHLLNNGKFDIVHIQNATLAGGVAVGTTADKNIRPFGAMIIGSVAGILSTSGFKVVQPIIRKFGLHDTCGVNNLHGMPGLLAGVVGIIVAAVLRTDSGNTGLLKTCYHYNSRTPLMQVGYQAITLLVTSLIAIGGGILTGILLKLPIFNKKHVSAYFDDSPNWETPEDFDKGHYIGHTEVVHATVA